MRFTKMHGLGNDFLIVDDREPAAIDWPAAARRLCDRRRGVGADGILLIGSSVGADLRMQLFNADGSEGEMCGNGVRCVALFVLERGIAPERVVWETGAGPVITQVVGKGLVTVDMGPPRFLPAEIPVDAAGADPLHLPLEAAGRRFEVSAVGMGNPHCVLRVDDVEGFPVAEVGPALEAHPAFPHHTNVEFVAVLSPAHVRQRTFERGVGETDACGTGACASMVALRRLGLVATAVDVELNGGTLRIEWPDSGSVFMTGPAETVFSSEVAVPVAAALRS